MANPKVYTLTTIQSGTNALATTHASVAANATLTSNGVPCKGAKMVVFRLVGTDSNTISSNSVTVGNVPGRGALGGVFSATGVGYSVSGNFTGAAVNASGTGGMTLAVYPNNAGQRAMHHDYAFIQVTAGASGHANVTISAEVHYDFDGDQQMNGNGQGGIVPLTT